MYCEETGFKGLSGAKLGGGVRWERRREDRVHSKVTGWWGVDCCSTPWGRPWSSMWLCLELSDPLRHSRLAAAICTVNPLI